MKTLLLIATIFSACSSSAAPLTPDAEVQASVACPDAPWLAVYGMPLPTRCENPCDEEPSRSRSCTIALEGGILATCNTTVRLGLACCRREGERVKLYICQQGAQ